MRNLNLGLEYPEIVGAADNYDDLIRMSADSVREKKTAFHIMCHNYVPESLNKFASDINEELRKDNSAGYVRVHSINSSPHSYFYIEFLS